MSFLQSSQPKISRRKRETIQTVWRGLNTNDVADNGYISDGENFHISSSGTLSAIGKPIKVYSGYNKPLAFVGIDNYLFVVYNNGKEVIIERINTQNGKKHSATLSNSDLKSKRSLMRYNVWSGDSNIVDGTFSPKVLIYPDKKVIGLNDEPITVGNISRYEITQITKTTITTTTNTYFGDTPESGVESVTESTKTNENRVFFGYADDDKKPKPIDKDGDTSTSGAVNSENKYVETIVTTSIRISYISNINRSAIPDAKIVCPYNTRVFGVNGTKIFCSAAASYVDYDLDTAEDINPDNAWYSATQSGGDFTALCTYGGRVMAFKENGMYELYNNKNPFRVKEISTVGTQSAESVSEVSTRLFFTANDGVYMYTGSYPKNVSDDFIDVRDTVDDTFFGSVVGGFDGRIYVRKHMKGEKGIPVLVFDLNNGSWEKINFFSDDVSYISHTSQHAYCILDTGEIYQLDSENKSNVSWFVETPIMSNTTADVKRLEHLQLLAKFNDVGSVRIFVKYDDDEYELIHSVGEINGTHPISCMIRKSDHVVRSVRIMVQGDVEILSMEQILTAGGTNYGY